MNMKTKLFALIVALLAVTLVPASVALAADGGSVGVVPSASGFPLLGIVLFAAPALVALIFGVYQYFTRM